MPTTLMKSVKATGAFTTAHSGEVEPWQGKRRRMALSTGGCGRATMYTLFVHDHMLYATCACLSMHPQDVGRR